MVRIVLTLVLFLAVSISPAARSAQPAAPYKPGDTWVYHDTRTAGERTETGTLTVVYRGQGQYRAGTYHYEDSYSSFTPGAVERDVLVWTGRYFRVRATVLHENSQAVLEIVFDRPYALSGVHEELAGIAELYERGSYAGKDLWAIDVVWQGTAKVTVPAGSFTAEKWTGLLRIGRLTHAYTVYTVGPQAISAEIDWRRDDEPMHTTRLELLKGPIYRR